MLRGQPPKIVEVEGQLVKKVNQCSSRGTDIRKSIERSERYPKTDEDHEVQ